jgi:hypothetical protein
MKLVRHLDRNTLKETEIYTWMESTGMSLFIGLYVTLYDRIVENNTLERMRKKVVMTFFKP